jgi:hypothetical protein
MQVTAFNTPKDPAWRWRIVNLAGEMIAESTERFASIQAAVANGQKRLAAMNVDDRSVPPSHRFTRRPQGRRE